jgi:nitroreductase
MIHMNSIQNNNAAIVDAAITSRRSVRAFRKDPVSLDVVGAILEVASRAPSSANMQPWRVYVVTGEARQRLVDVACRAYDNEPDQHVSELQYYPSTMFEPYLSRRRKMGLALYSLLGLKKEDKEGMRLQQRRNLQFFDAPVGMLFTMHRDLTDASLIDYGAFIGNIMTAARARGLDTCNVGAWSAYHRVVGPELKLTPQELLLGGMALGYEDTEALVSQLRTDRLPLSEFVTFLTD